MVPLSPFGALKVNRYRTGLLGDIVPRMRFLIANALPLIAPRRMLAGVLFALVASFAQPALAEKTKPPLQLGTSTGHVLTAWGEPVERIERALKQEVVWSYPQGAFVTFKKGQVISYQIAGSQVVDAKSQARQVAAQQTVAAAPTEAIAGATRDLVRDIAKELPSSPDAPYTEPPSQPGRAAARNQPPQPPAMIPGDAEADVEEDG